MAQTGVHAETKKGEQAKTEDCGYFMMKLTDQSIEGFNVNIERYMSDCKDNSYDNLSVTMTKEKDNQDNITIMRGWLGDANSESMKQKMSGHSHGSKEMHYTLYIHEFEAEDRKDTSQVTLQVETEKGKSFLIPVKFTQWETDHGAKESLKKNHHH
jgi:hypothetical protein